MLKAIVNQGQIVPLEPLPTEWKEGTTLDVIESGPAPVDIDEWAKEMNELCADSSPEEEEAMRVAIDEHRRQAKEQARREMGLQG